MIWSPAVRSSESSSNHVGRTLLSDPVGNLQCLLSLRLIRTGGGARPHIVRGLTKLWSPTLPSPTLTPLTTSSKFPHTARPLFYVTWWNLHLLAARVLRSPARSPCVRFSTDELTSLQPKLYSTGSMRRLFTNH